MLINYCFKNFRSFKDPSCLSMIASSQTTFSDNLIRENSERILPSAVIYGANASGKSNIILSLAVMKGIVLSGSVSSSIEELSHLELYPFAHDKEKNPICFEVEFINNKYQFKYGFDVLVEPFKKGTRKIIGEFLTVVKSKNSNIELFKRDNKKVWINHEKKALEILNLDESFLKTIDNKINSNLDETELFLSRAFKNTISNTIAECVIDFFKNKVEVVSDFTLKKVNLTMSTENMPQDDFSIWNDILDDFVKGADFGPQSVMLKAKKLDDGHSADMELYSVYNNVSIPSDLMESRGTLKLLDFAIPFQSLFKTGGTFVLDEFDAAIHPEIIKGIISLFNNQKYNRCGAQLIFTTHNPIYLNNKMFRRDQIKFVEKDKSSFISTIYSLADFGSTDVRNDENYLINYFKGKYSSLPFIDFSRLIVDEEKK